MQLVLNDKRLSIESLQKEVDNNTNNVIDGGSNCSFSTFLEEIMNTAFTDGEIRITVE